MPVEEEEEGEEIPEMGREMDKSTVDLSSQSLNRKGWQISHPTN